MDAKSELLLPNGEVVTAENVMALRETNLRGWREVAALRARAEVPEGCTPTDARVLRQANHGLADEISALMRERDALRAALDGLSAKWRTKEANHEKRCDEELSPALAEWHAGMSEATGDCANELDALLTPTQEPQA